MKTLHVQGVNEALQVGMLLLKHDGELMSSRNGDTFEYPGPVCTTYHTPWRRVLFDPLRDANPFFHYMESLWILAGRNDVAFLDQFNSGMKRYSQDGSTFHGAYGHRMRHMNGLDQLNWAVEQLRIDPLTRRCVVQIWDARRDCDHNVDIPCNDMIMFRARPACSKSPHVLDMTVCNRSNDIIWGAYGANAVHFSIVHEYVAARAQLSLGRYHQVSNSYHAYTDNPYWKSWDSLRFFTNLYDSELTDLSHFPLFNRPDVVDLELEAMLDCFDNCDPEELHKLDWSHGSNFALIGFPMYIAWKYHKERNYDAAYEYLRKLPPGADDWFHACNLWLRVREYNYQAAQVQT